MASSVRSMVSGPDPGPGVVRQPPEWVEIVGGERASGQVRVAGAKNAATKMLVAAMLAREGPSVVHNVPDIGDVAQTLELLESVGVGVRRRGRLLTVTPNERTGSTVHSAPGSTNRLPLLVAAALLHEHRSVVVPTPGGCPIGARPTDLWVQVLQRLGCSVSEAGEGWRISRRPGGLVGARVVLAYPSVAATETALIAGVLADGRTVVRNAAREPEVVALGRMLIAMGARITGLGTSRLAIDGVRVLEAVEWRVPGDRIEAASWAVLAAITDGDVAVGGCDPSALSGFLQVFQAAGGGFEQSGPDSMRFFRRRPLSAAVLNTGPWPAFSTDYQQPMAVLFTQARGASLVHETVYERRLGFLETLQRMGAEVRFSIECPPGPQCRFAGRYEHVAKIGGRNGRLCAIDGLINLPDLRGGMALVTAAAVAEGTSRLAGWEQVARGYQDLAGRLRRLGISVSMVRQHEQQGRVGVAADGHRWHSQAVAGTPPNSSHARSYGGHHGPEVADMRGEDLAQAPVSRSPA